MYKRQVADLRRIASIAHEAGALLVVDASQSAGCVPIDMASMGLDVVCFTGHKGLMGPQGTGGLAVREGVDVRPWAEGGSGVRSFSPHQPEEWPTRLEAGTLNAHGLAGLSAALDYLRSIGGPSAVGEKERNLAASFAGAVRDLPGVTLYGDLEQPCLLYTSPRAGSPGAPRPSRGTPRPRDRRQETRSWPRGRGFPGW